ncbi:MAG: YdcF family protein [Candidatus Nanogingivalaceae bacterium]|nr:YdcF family protein [Candidatus Nanogingivalaceae bacterium]
MSRSQLALTDQDWHHLHVLWEYLCVESRLPARADAIVIGGAGAMIDGAERAAELYHAGISPWIVVSGFANPYHGATETEAMLLGRRLQRLAVPISAILFEHQATNTGENITRSAQLLAEMMIQSKDIILVHKPYMTRRFLATAEAQWPHPPRLYVTSQPTTVEVYYRLYEATYGSAAMMLTLMLGDYERIKTYPTKGFSTPQPLSPSADTAWQALVARGFLPKAQ